MALLAVVVNDDEEAEDEDEGWGWRWKEKKGKHLLMLMSKQLNGKLINREINVWLGKCIY